MENWHYDSEMGGYLTLCDRCGTARGVRERESGDYLCPPCDRAWNEIGKEYDDHYERQEERRQMGLGNL